MKKLVSLLLICCVAFAVAGCRHKKESPYNRTDDKQDYERLLNKHVFAACQNIMKPYALYSLATLNKRPTENDPHYKITFVNGPCKGKVLFTKDVILKTEPLEGGAITKGTVVLRNYWNPSDPYNQEKTDRWHKAVVSSTARMDKGIIDLEFPRDKNDFMPAREGAYLHNVRFITQPEIKDVRTFLF